MNSVKNSNKILIYREKTLWDLFVRIGIIKISISLKRVLIFTGADIWYNLFVTNMRPI